MKRLHYRLSAAMLAITVLLGAAFYVVDRYSMRLYYEELSQRLNESLAMYVVNAKPLIVDGRVNRDTLAELANLAMVVNPTAEIYLLDSSGRILGHVFPPEEVAVERVEIAPVLELLSPSPTLPIKGIDPRDPSTRKVFSAFPVTDPANPGSPVAYLYVVLGGSHYMAAAAQVSGGDAQRVVTAAIVLLMLMAFVAGVVLFSLLTRRLRRLTGDVTAFTQGEFEADGTIKPVENPRDEIDQLRNACQSMASTIRRQVSSLRENDRLRRELVTNISHDLRTPLANMKGYIETLLIKDETLDSQDRRQYLEIARKHAVHLEQLIHDLFDLAMLDASRVTPVVEEFPLTELIQDVVQEFELIAREAGVSLHVAPPEEPVSAHADISLIQRVLENLVGNALKYTPEGGKVSISVRPSSTSVGVSVADNGRGISKEDLPRIFDRFYKSDPEDASAGNSTGLGLAIAKRIVELHGGTIVVTSEEQRGTEFRFELPRQQRAA